MDVDDDGCRLFGGREPQVETLFREGTIGHLGVRGRNPNAGVALGLQRGVFVVGHFLLQTRRGPILAPLGSGEASVLVQIGGGTAFELPEQESVVDRFFLRGNRGGKKREEDENVQGFHRLATMRLTARAVALVNARIKTAKMHPRKVREQQSVFLREKR